MNKLFIFTLGTAATAIAGIVARNVIILRRGAKLQERAEIKRQEAVDRWLEKEEEKKRTHTTTELPLEDLGAALGFPGPTTKEANPDLSYDMAGGEGAIRTFLLWSSDGYLIPLSFDEEQWEMVCEVGKWSQKTLEEVLFDIANDTFLRDE